MGRATRFAIGLLLYAVALPVHAATITVTNTNDSGAGSLRQALAVAHDRDRITFAVSGVITLTSDGLGVTKNVTISGPGADQLSIDGNQGLFLFVFGVFPQRTVSISGLSIRNAQVGVYNNQGTLSVSNCVLSGNSTAALDNDAGEGSGGASMTVANSIISNNFDGAVNVLPATIPMSASITSGRISANQSSADGPCAGMTITDSVVSNNNGLGITNQSEPPPFGPTRTMARGSTSIRKPTGNGSAAGNCTACMTIANSVVTGNVTGIFNAAYPPRAATVTVLNTSFTGNLGGIGTYGFEGDAEVTVTNSTISGSFAYSGIDSGFSNVSIANSTINGSSPLGGINVRGMRGLGLSVSIVNSTISGNSADQSGGGISADGLDYFSIVNSTISGNSAGTSGGGIYNSNSSLHVANSTIAGNSAGSGGGIYNGPQGQVQISNTIIDGGASGENIFNSGGTVTSQGYNLSSDDGGGYLNGPGDQINTDPLLGPLQDNGGPTFTHALLPGSPAIDAGDPNFSPPPFNDQRGCPFDRVFNGRIDIGSFETQPPRRPCPTPRSRPTPPPRP
jgi:hypothetical protein